VSQTNTCEVDPCLTIRCPTDCYTCKVTTDGIGTCIIDNDKCQPVNMTAGVKGGGGSGCEVSGTASGSPLALLLGLALIAGRKRRRR
jgi:MYXO-CTERM domain-containing protein